jgi:GntR family transcriptional regulator
MNSKTLSGDDRVPAYQRLADDLRAVIAAGELKPGDRAPSENQLAADYSLSAGTVRKALEVLVSEHVFERFQGRGTYVRRPSFDSSLFRFFRFKGPDGEVHVPESRILRRKTEPIPSYVSRALKVPEQTVGLSMSRLRLIENTPLVAEEIWLEYEPFKSFAKLPIEDIGSLLYPVYDQLCGKVVAKAEETLTVETASRQTASLLRVEKGTPIIVIDRIARGFDESPIEWRRSRGRADIFSYHTEIR